MLAGVVLTALSWPAIQKTIRRFLIEVAIERTRLAIEDRHRSTIRLTRNGGPVVATIAHRLPRAIDDAKRAALAAQLLQRTDNAGSDADVLRGYAYLLTGRADRAAAALTSAAERQRSAALWSDAAAAEYVAAFAGGQEGSLLAGLVAADHALAFNPRQAEASLNRASIIEALGVGPATKTVSDADAWRALSKTLCSMPAASIVDRTRQFPQQARTYAEGPFLASWADAIVRRDVAMAEGQLQCTSIIGETLRRQTGEALIADAVAAIRGSRRPDDLTEGHLAYRDGRMAYRDLDFATAERHLADAERAFSRARSPMASMARFFVASMLVDQNRVDEALEILLPLLHAERRAGGTHKALIAKILHELALCNALLGHWSDSLDNAMAARAAFLSLRERGSAAEAEAVLSEDYDFLGQPQQARRHGIAALRGTCASGDLGRARVVLAALSRTELRAGRWEYAQSLIRLEAAFSASAPDSRLDADMCLREAAAEFHIGGSARASSALARARSAAAKVADQATRERLLADVDGVDGTISPASDSRRSIRLLSSAISFQKAAARPIVLPELLLERGRRHAMLDALDAAQRDFDDGILELERQRSRVREVEIRPGIFDDAADLFHQAVALQLRRGNEPSLVFSYVERGRARTALEQMIGYSSPPRVSLAELQRRLSPRMAVVEYAALPESLLIFVITGDRVTLRQVAVTRAAIASAADAFSDALSARKPVDVTRALAARLHDSLISPVGRELQGRTSITIVPDDALDRIPFAALLDRETGSYLIERAAITSAPSAAMVLSLLTRRAKSDRPLSSVLIVANPDIPRDLFPDLESLDAAEREAPEIAHRYRHAAVLLREKATGERFLALSPSFDVVHFAGHAVVYRNDPAASAIICAPSADSAGPVTARRIAAMRFHRTRLVVLAACSTLRGRNAAVEGVPSLARTFLTAGVPMVVGTLWDIEDRVAAPFLIGMHGRVARGVRPADAVRAAQMDAIHSPTVGRRDPAVWAAFALLGVEADRP